MPSYEYKLVNAFVPSASSSPSSSGNPAAVVLLPYPTDLSGDKSDPAAADDFESLFPPAPVLQAIGKKLDKPMTSFLVPLPSSASNSASTSNTAGTAGTAIGHAVEKGNSIPEYALRWFDAEAEWKMCGHGTVGAAEALLAQGYGSPAVDAADQVKLRIKNGHVLVKRGPAQASVPEGGTKGTEAAQDHRVVIDLPTVPSPQAAGEEWTSRARSLLDRWGVGAHLADVYTAGDWILIRLNGQADLRGVKADLADLSLLKPKSVTLFQIAPSSSPDGEHVQTRVFPGNFVLGGNSYTEDNGTGSAHGAVVPILLTHVRAELLAAHPSLSAQSNPSLKIRQLSPRGGEMLAKWDAAANRIQLEARAWFVETGTVDVV